MTRQQWHPLSSSPSWVTGTLSAQAGGPGGVLGGSSLLTV